MNNIEKSNVHTESLNSGTRINLFLATKGVIIIKETREIGVIVCEYEAELRISTLILATARSSTKVSDKIFGISFDIKGPHEREESALLDFDESDEFSNAITFLHEASRRIASEKRDYTEATFRTKDLIQIGFYQGVYQEQRAFIQLSNQAKPCFIQVSSLPKLKNVIDDARNHLIAKGMKDQDTLSP